MKPRDKWSFALAMLFAIPAVMGLMNLYDSRDLRADYDGPLYALIVFVWIYQAYRKPKSNAEN
jgi:hypothetical protein